MRFVFVFFANKIETFHETSNPSVAFDIFMYRPCSLYFWESCKSFRRISPLKRSSSRSDPSSLSPRRLRNYVLAPKDVGPHRRKQWPRYGRRGTLVCSRRINHSSSPVFRNLNLLAPSRRWVFPFVCRPRGALSLFSAFITIAACESSSMGNRSDSRCYVKITKNLWKGNTMSPCDSCTCWTSETNPFDCHGKPHFETPFLLRVNSDVSTP